MTPILATSRHNELILAAVLAGVAAIFLVAGAISAVVARRRRDRELEATERDRPDDGAGPIDKG